MSDVPTYGRRKLIVALIAGIVVFSALVALNVSLYVQIAVLQTDKNYLQGQVFSLQYDKSFMQGQIENLQDKWDQVNGRKDMFESIANFSQSTIIYPLQNRTIIAGTPNFIGSENLDYAGYLDVSLNSTSNSTYVMIAYSSKAGDLSFQKTFGFSGREIFFVLPTPENKLYIGNTETNTGTVNVTFSVTYYC
jgi:cell division protein FtsB